MISEIIILDERTCALKVPREDGGAFIVQHMGDDLALFVLRTKSYPDPVSSHVETVAQSAIVVRSPFLRAVHDAIGQVIGRIDAANEPTQD